MSASTNVVVVAYKPTRLAVVAFRFRLTPTSAQAGQMLDRCAEARFVWNLGVEQQEFAMRYRPYRTGKRQHWPSAQERETQLKEARHEFVWLEAGSRMVQTQALRDLDQAFRNWWGNSAHFRRPTWRKARDNNGFNITDVSGRISAKGAVRAGRCEQINRKWATISIPKIGPVRFRLTRPYHQVAACKSARVSLDQAGRWHVSFSAPQPAVPKERTGAVCGIDLGVIRSATTSNGVHLDMPALLTAGERQRKRRLQRQMARQRKGSNRRNRTKAKIARIFAREADRRKNWVEQTTTRLVREYDLIAVENLAPFQAA